MSIWLIMKTSNGDERPFRVKDRITIGRETRCHVRIAVPSVSSNHCEIVVIAGVPKLADLGSDNGTYHNGARVREAILKHADTLTVGPVTFEIRIEGASSGGQLADGKSAANSISEPKPIAVKREKPTQADRQPRK